MQRPEGMLYWIDERPPFLKLLMLAIQQMLTVSITLVLIPIILGASNVSQAQIVNSLSWSLIAMALGTFLQALRKGPVGSGFLAPPIVSAIYLNVSILAVQQGGLPCLITMTVFAGILEIILSHSLKYLRTLFTPAVIGLIVFMVGFMLGMIAWEKIIDVGHFNSAQFDAHIFSAFIALLSIFAFSIWAKGLFRLISIFLGVVVGCLVASLLGLFDKNTLHFYHDLPWLILPTPPAMTLYFSKELALPFAICAIIAAMRVIGTIISCQQINDADWRSPNYPSIKRGVLSDGINLLFAGLVGSPGMSASPSSVGVSKLTGANSRYIAYMLSFLFLIMAFFPKIVGLFLLIPLPIAGVALLVNCSFMMLAGIQIITIRPIDIRTIYTVGIAILTGISRIMLPEYYDKLPDGWKIVTTSALTITTISALLMTLLFRIGIKKNLVLDKDAPLGKPQEFNHYLKTQFNRWAVPEVIMEKASTCGEQILNSLIQTGLNPDAIKVNTSFDKINLKLEYEYEGEFPSLNLNEGMSKKYYVEEQAFYLGLSRLLSGVFPDDHHFVMKGKQCSLTFWFYC